MSIARIAALLHRQIGLDAVTIGISAVERAIQGRVAALGMADSEEYWNRLIGSPQEIQELIEAVVVPETWFFRDPEAFNAMAEAARAARERSPTALRLLSLPCSTGEEPYSMAMALLDAGFPPASFVVDAVDISRPAILAAEAAIYGRNSFRSKDLGFRDRYFTPVPRGFRLDERVRALVRFRQANVFKDDLAAEGEVYDIVFCRNMLIYFDDQGKTHCLSLIRRLLRPDGLVFVGPSEASLLQSHDFASARIPLAFGFRKAPKPADTARPAAAPRPKLNPRPSAPLPVPKAVSVASREAAPPLDETEAVRRLADQGDLAEAGRRGEAHIRAQGASPEMLYLMGLIQDAQANYREAIKYYRKTIFLAPDHERALAHLALLLERQGSREDAKVVNDRILRLEQRSARKK